MRKIIRLYSVTLFILFFCLSSAAAAGKISSVKPEKEGFSSERLERIHELMQRNMDEGNFAGAVTVIAKNGRVIHFETHGMMDLEANKPMEKDAIFRIMSMTKPVVGVSILMLLEEGKPFFSL